MRKKVKGGKWSKGKKQSMVAKQSKGIQQSKVAKQIKEIKNSKKIIKIKSRRKTNFGFSIIFFGLPSLSNSITP